MLVIGCGEPSLDSSPLELPVNLGMDSGSGLAPGSNEPDALLPMTDASTRFADAAEIPEPPPPFEAPFDGLTPLRDVTFFQTPLVDNDSLISMLDRGNFPDFGEGVEGTRTWSALAQLPNGVFESIDGNAVVAFARIALGPNERLVATPDFTSRLWTQSSIQPGDAYGERKSLLPLSVAGNIAEIAVLLGPSRGATRLRLYKTDRPVVLNLADLTFPTLLVGRSEELPIGLPLVVTDLDTLTNVSVSVLEDENWHSTTRVSPSLVGGAATQVSALLRPKRIWSVEDEEISVTVRVDADELVSGYEQTFSLPVGDPSDAYRRTFDSTVDGSVQYYGVREPSETTAAEQYGLVLSLHGAAVEAVNLAQSYTPKDWTYIITPTNRRPFGFDWEEWGRFNALASLAHAKSSFAIDPTKVHLVGHSMGGHGTWHVGSSTPTHFATLGPSAGWDSFYTYGGTPRPEGAFARARAHSTTLNYLSNIARRGVYVIHGTADNNVPLSQGWGMFRAAEAHTDDIEMHREEGANHWWDNPATDGVDCVDWPPLFEFMKARRLDPLETNFDFRSEGPSYSATHSYLTVISTESVMSDFELSSREVDGELTLTTTNVAAMSIDGTALTERGVTSLLVDGETVALDSGVIELGIPSLKQGDTYGPFNQVFRRPFCLLYASDESAYAKVARYYASYWQLFGNGRTCGIATTDPLNVPEGTNTVLLGGTPTDGMQAAGIDWSGQALSIGDDTISRGILASIRPTSDGLTAVFVTSPGDEHWLTYFVPFNSRSGMPDYFLWQPNEFVSAGFYDTNWQLE